MSALARTPMTLYQRLRAAGIEVKYMQIVLPGKVMWWKGRKLLHTDDLSKFTGAGIPFFPREADTACVAPADYAQIGGSA
jgi:hypothetical protein